MPLSRDIGVYCILRKAKCGFIGAFVTWDNLLMRSVLVFGLFDGEEV